MISAGSGKSGQGNGTRVLVKANAWRRALALAQATAYWQGISTAAKTNGRLRTAKNKAHLNIKGLKVGVNRLNRKAAKRVVGMNERSCPKLSCSVSRTRLTAVFFEPIHEVNHVLA
jgi:CYTH domain-containing protein